MISNLSTFVGCNYAFFALVLHVDGGELFSVLKMRCFSEAFEENMQSEEESYGFQTLMRELMAAMSIGAQTDPSRIPGIV